MGVGRADSSAVSRWSSSDSYSLARNINDNRESSRLAGLGHEFGSDEFGDGLGEVDAIDKDVD